MKSSIPYLLVLFLNFPLQGIQAQPSLSLRDPQDGPQTFAMVLGISKYKYVRPLTFADKDAELFRDYLKSPAGGSVKNENIYCLLNEQATNSNFWIKGFQWLRTRDLKKGDRLFIYLAGHGDAIDENQFFFLGYDCNPRGDKNNYLVAGAIQLFNLKLKIASETAKGVDVFFIMDACRSNELPGGVKGQQSLSNAITEKKAGEIIMLAASAGQSSFEDASIGNGNGLFTYYLINGLSGLADSAGNADNRVSLAEIEHYINKNVPVVAESKFKRRQQPFFCCEDMRDHIISRVDTAYLKNWLKTKVNKGPGNSFKEIIPSRFSFPDTSLLEIYDLFTRSVKDKQLTGINSAESFYNRMEERFPGNAYTLDARSTLAAAFVGYAQERVDRFLDCGELPGTENYTDYKEAASRLEKAISLLKPDEPQFSASYLSRLYFLKSTESLDYAYAAFALDPDAAFISNLLALLHKRNNNMDSALYYARRTVSLAPSWRCGYTTLSIITGTREQKESPGNKDRTQLKSNWGLLAGGGMNSAIIEYSDWEQRNINYHDSLSNIATNGGSAFGFGVFLQFNFTPKFALQPSAFISLNNFDIVYSRKTATGLPFTEKIMVKTTSVSIDFPLRFRLMENKASPYLGIGPVIVLRGQDNASEMKIPLTRASFSGVFALGAEISLPGGLVIAPQVSYTRSLSNDLNNINNLYTNTLSSLKQENYLFKVLIRK